MPIKRVEYKGMMISAGAFEVVELSRFVSTLSIAKNSGREAADYAKVFSPPWPAELFADAGAALASAIAFGHLVIDGKIPGLTMDDPKAN